MRLHEPLQHKLKCAKSDLPEDWEEFFDLACISKVDVNQKCSSLIDRIYNFAATDDEVVANSEQSMIPLVNSALQLLPLFLNMKADRNVQGSTTGTKKPDNEISDLFREEDKLRSNYLRGVYDHDPVQENVDKTPWSRWEEFYGNANFILASAAIGEPGNVIMVVGALVRETKSFHPLFEYNIASDRALV